MSADEGCPVLLPETENAYLREQIRQKEARIARLRLERPATECDESWPVPLPESDWTPGQRAAMDWHRRLNVRYAHQARIVTWKNRQRKSHQWVNLGEVADWCARKAGSVARDEGQRAQALTDLANSIEFGEFSRNGRLQIAYLPDSVPHLRVRWPSAGMQPGALPLCWAPAALCHRWFAARGIPLPPWLAEAAIVEPVRPAPAVRPAAAPPTEAARSVPAVKPTVKRDASRAWAAWLAERGPDNQPTRKEAEKWATDNGHSLDQGRKLHQSLELPLGRRKKSR